MTDVTVTCLECGKSFQADRSTAKFCSGACKMRSRRKRGVLPESPPVPKVSDEELERTMQELEKDITIRVGIESPRVRSVAEGSIAANHYEDSAKMHPFDLLRERRYPSTIISGKRISSGSACIVIRSS